MERRDKINYYLDIAETVCERGTCLRRNFGAIIVHNDEIIATTERREALKTVPTSEYAPVKS
jgi:deoxycytidylate deaminase